MFCIVHIQVMVVVAVAGAMADMESRYQAVAGCCPVTNCSYDPDHNTFFHFPVRGSDVNYIVWLGKPLDFNCSEHEHQRFNISNLKIIENSPMIEDPLTSDHITADLFCVSVNVVDDDQVFEAHYCNNTSITTSSCRSFLWVKHSLTGVSCVALLIIFALYLFCDKLKTYRGVHSWSVINMVLAQFLFLVFHLVITYVPRWYSNQHLCIAIALVYYGVSLSFLCWLTVISFDLWHKKWKRLQQSKRTFVYYLAFAWGCPAAATTIVGLLNTFGQSSGAIVPNISVQNSCFFQEGAATWVYMFAPMVLLLLANLLCFLIGICRLLRKVKSRIPSNQTRQFFGLQLSMHMAITCGIVWTLQLVSNSVRHIQPCSVWVQLVDLVCSCQGIILLVVVLCKIHSSKLATSLAKLDNVGMLVSQRLSTWRLGSKKLPTNNDTELKEQQKITNREDKERLECITSTTDFVSTSF